GCRRRLARAQRPSWRRERRGVGQSAGWGRGWNREIHPRRSGVRGRRDDAGWGAPRAGPSKRSRARRDPPYGCGIRPRRGVGQRPWTRCDPTRREDVTHVEPEVEGRGTTSRRVLVLVPFPLDSKGLARRQDQLSEVEI